MSALYVFATLVSCVVAVAWASILLQPSRAWRLQPVAEDEPPAPEPAKWPSVAVLVPARNEARALALTLPALLAQDYPGRFHVWVVDERSDDGTGRVVEGFAAGGELLTMLPGAALPAGWAGKVWGLEQAMRAVAGEDAPRYLLLTDADILHSPSSLRRLVAECEAASLVLCSRMAALRCKSRAERLLIPAYVYFFNLLYPMRRANDPHDRLAAAAGGCVLVAREALQRAGGFTAISDRIIDDIALARLVKGHGGHIRLALSRREVSSVRVYDEDAAGRSTALLRGDVWRMVRRSAFTELGHSWARLVLCMLLLTLVFLAPPLLLAAGLLAVMGGAPGLHAGAMLVAGAGACIAMGLSYLPALRLFGLPAWRVLTLPWVALLFALMTLDSAFLHRRAAATEWR